MEIIYHNKIIVSDFENNRFQLLFRDDEKIIEKINMIDGKKWEAGKRVWTVPKNEETIKHLKKNFLNLVWETKLNYKYKEPEEVEELIKILDKKIIVSGYSILTRKAYEAAIRKFCEYFEIRSREEIVRVDFESYIVYMFEKGCSDTTINQSISGLKFFFSEVLGLSREAAYIKRPKITKKLPNVLSTDEVILIMTNVVNLKHRAILMIIYSSGLRVSEAVNLRIKDIDSSRMMLAVRSGKGKKDRYTMLSNVALEVLKIYYRKYKPYDWVFQGQEEENHISERSIQAVFKKALRIAGIKKDVSLHCLRHSFATHLLETGTDIRFIQELLGHANLKTTEIYTHVARRIVQNIESPLDKIMKNKE